VTGDELLYVAGIIAYHFVNAVTSLGGCPEPVCTDDSTENVTMASIQLGFVVTPGRISTAHLLQIKGLRDGGHSASQSHTVLNRTLCITC